MTADHQDDDRNAEVVPLRPDAQPRTCLPCSSRSWSSLWRPRPGWPSSGGIAYGAARLHRWHARNRQTIPTHTLNQPARRTSAPARLNPAARRDRDQPPGHRGCNHHRRDHREEVTGHGEQRREGRGPGARRPAEGGARSAAEDRYGGEVHVARQVVQVKDRVELSLRASGEDICPRVLAGLGTQEVGRHASARISRPGTGLVRGRPQLADRRQ